jgi:ABC-type transporter Mla MlaB component
LLTFRIHRIAKADGCVFAVSGELTAEAVTELVRLLEQEVSQPVALDVADLTLVDRAAVCFLAQCESMGIDLPNCPSYVLEWIKAERSPP